MRIRPESVPGGRGRRRSPRGPECACHRFRDRAPGSRSRSTGSRSGERARFPGDHQSRDAKGAVGECGAGHCLRRYPSRCPPRWLPGSRLSRGDVRPERNGHGCARPRSRRVRWRSVPSRAGPASRREGRRAEHPRVPRERAPSSKRAARPRRGGRRSMAATANESGSWSTSRPGPGRGERHFRSRFRSGRSRPA